MKEFEPKNVSSLEQILASLKETAEVNPDPTFRRNAGIRLLNRISAGKQVPVSQKYTGFFAKPFQLAFACLMVFLVGGAGTVFAAQSSLPTDTLYPVKQASEQTLLGLTPSPWKGEVALAIADRRADELKKLITLGKNNQIATAVADYAQSIKQVEATDNVPQSVIDAHVAIHQQVLNQVLQQVPNQAKPAIEHAINASDALKSKNRKQRN